MNIAIYIIAMIIIAIIGNYIEKIKNRTDELEDRVTELEERIGINKNDDADELASDINNDTV